MKRFFLLLLIALVGSAASGLAQTDKPADAAKPGQASADEVAVIKTSAGEMVLQFWPNVAPKTVENFKKLAREGFYDGTAFHRIIKGFMIQGGDPNTKDPAKADEYGKGGPGYRIKGEVNDRLHEKGVISMAHSGHPDTAGSQFFICLDRAPHLDKKYTAFGKLIKGEDVLLKIGNAPVVRGPTDPVPSKPKERVGIESIKIVPASSVK